MRFYLLYKIGQFMAILCPVKVSYFLAERLADIKRHLSKDDTQAVKENLRIILGDDKDRIDECTKHVFRNFAKYLVDFFRFEDFEKFSPDFTGIYAEYSERTRLTKYDHVVPDDCFHAYMFARIAKAIVMGEYVKYLSSGQDYDDGPTQETL